MTESLTPLFNIAFPKVEICAERELYFHSGDGAIYDGAEGALVFSRGAAASFDTYFNCFSFAKYLRCTVVSDLVLRLVLKGSFIVTLAARREDGKKEILLRREIDAPARGEFFLEHDFGGDTGGGFYYFELEALSDAAVMYGGAYLTKSVPDDAFWGTKIAAVICTYKREENVYKNMTALNEYLNSATELSARLSVFVVDNANTLNSEKLPHGPATVFKNKNLGGSGGFARGMLEVFFRKSEFSHVLLMDDDAVFDPETINKTYSFLLLRKPSLAELCVGGAMLEAERPYFLHEAAALWRGRSHKLINHGLDLRSADAVIKNEKFFRADYCSWRFACMPLTIMEKHGFPLPFFIKIDEAEYALRAVKDWAFLSGIGVWHTAFDGRDNGYYEYYIKRNEAVTDALHRKSALREIYKLFLYTGRQIIKRRYVSAQLGFRAYKDFLAGPDFFLNTDAEKLNTELQGFFRGGKARGFFGTCCGYISMAFKLLFRYRRAAKSYKNRLTEISSPEFWQNQLELT